MAEGSVVMKFAPFYRDTWVEVNLDAIYNNIIRIKKLIPENVEFIAVVSRRYSCPDCRKNYNGSTYDSSSLQNADWYEDNFYRRVKR